MRPKGREEMLSVNNGEAAEETATDLEGAYAERRNGISSSNQHCAKLKQLNPPELNISLNVEDIARRKENEENGLKIFYSVYVVRSKNVGCLVLNITDLFLTF